MTTRGTCIHYTGMLYNKNPCRAGVDYFEEFGPLQGIALRAPCITERCVHEKRPGRGAYEKVWLPWDRRGETEIPCAKRQLPTPEQVAESDAEIVALMARMRSVWPVVAEWKKTNPPGSTGVVKCPVCNGTLRLATAKYNGHTHGKCDTPDCVSWVQ